MQWTIHAEATAAREGTSGYIAHATAEGSVELSQLPALNVTMVRVAGHGSENTTAAPMTAAGDVAAFVVTAINTGNVHLKNVEVLVPGLSTPLKCNDTLAVLSFGSALKCSGSLQYDQDTFETGLKNFTAIGAASNLATGASSGAIAVEVEATPRLTVAMKAEDCSKPNRMRK